MVFDKTAYDRKYYQTNKQKKLERMKERITCDVCATVYPRGHKSYHVKTDYHQKYSNNIVE